MLPDAKSNVSINILIIVRDLLEIFHNDDVCKKLKSYIHTLS